MTTTFQTALSNTGSYCCCRRGFWLATKAVSSKMGSKKQHLGFALVSLVLSRELNPENCLVFSEEINQLIVCCCFQGWFECCISSLTRMAQYEFIQAFPAFQLWRWWTYTLTLQTNGMVYFETQFCSLNRYWSLSFDSSIQTSASVVDTIFWRIVGISVYVYVYIYQNHHLLYGKVKAKDLFVICLFHYNTSFVIEGKRKCQNIVCIVWKTKYGFEYSGQKAVFSFAAIFN